MGCVLYPLIWVPQFKSLLPSRVQWKQNKLGYLYLKGTPEALQLSLKIITPSAYQSSEMGGIIYREINSLRQSIEFYNLSGIGCIVPSAKATEFHVIKIKKKKKSKNMPLTTILGAIIFSLGIYIGHQEEGKL